MEQRTLLVVLAVAALAGLVGVLLFGPADQRGPLAVDRVCDLAEPVQSPTGREVRLCQTLSEPQPSGEVWTIIRVIDRRLATEAADINHLDHDWACDLWGVAAARDQGAARVIVQMMAEPFPRGEPNPGISQAIEAYSIQNGTCIWELL